MAADKDHSQTFARGLAVLRAFDDGAAALSVPEIARRAGLNRTVTRRLVFTLCDLGYLGEDDHRYTLTPRVLRLAHGFLRARRVGAGAQPALLEASRRTGLPVSLAMRDGAEALYVAQAPADPALVTQGFTIGSPLPLAATAIGRVLIAFEDPDTRAALVKTVPLAAYTVRACTDRGRLAALLDDIRRDGHAFADEQFEPGVAALALPVRRREGDLLSAIGLATRRERLADTAERARLVAELRDCAGRLATVL